MANGPGIGAWGNGHVVLQAPNGQFISMQDGSGSIRPSASYMGILESLSLKLADLSTNVIIYRNENFSGACQILSEGMYEQ